MAIMEIKVDNFINVTAVRRNWTEKCFSIISDSKLTLFESCCQSFKSNFLLLVNSIFWNLFNFKNYVSHITFFNKYPLSYRF